MSLLGKAAPSFNLPSSDGGSISLQALRGSYVVLFFYPKDSTPGCTLEAQGFTQARSAFAAQNTVVFGISKDSVASHCKFRDKYGLTIPLLSDATGATVEAFGAWGEKNLYGKVSQGIIRSTFLIDPAGTVIQQWRKVKVPGHVEAVLAAVNGASAGKRTITMNMNDDMQLDFNTGSPAPKAAKKAAKKMKPAAKAVIAIESAIKKVVQKAAKAVKSNKAPKKAAVAAPVKKAAKKAQKAVAKPVKKAKTAAKKVVAKAKKAGKSTKVAAKKAVKSAVKKAKAKTSRKR